MTTGLTPPTSDEENFSVEGFPWIRPEDLDESGLETTASRFVSDNGWRLLRKVEPGSSLICCIGTIGKCGYVQSTVSTNQQITAATFIGDGRFGFYLLQAARKELEELATGNVLKILNTDRLGALGVVKVPEEEQRTIAAFLDHETARIDRLIEKQQRLIELLKEKRQAVISHAVTKGLDPDVPMKDSGVEWLGQVPAHWLVAGFKKYLALIVDYRGKTPNKTESGVFLVTARNIKNGIVDYSLSQEFISEDEYEEVMRRGKPEVGDVLFTTEAPLGEVAQVDDVSVALAQRIIKFRGQPEVLNNAFLKYFIQSEAFQQGLKTYATGSTALGIKAERLVYLKQLVPPWKEQLRIVEMIEAQMLRIGQVEKSAQQAIALMKERRTALISAAVTGKIDVRNWQPNTSTQAAESDLPMAAEQAGRYHV
jgi:type I restriction enzyme S subunit